MLRALPNLKKLDNVEVSPEEVREALKGDFLQQKQQQQQPEYSDDFESQYRQQAATSGFRGHSPIREVSSFKIQRWFLLWDTKITINIFMSLR